MTLLNTSTPRVLSIAGTDPTGGAGIQADLKSIAASGGYGMCATTALVAQNTQGVRSIFAPPTEFLQEQLAAVFDDVTVDAVKIGMLGDVETITTVKTWLAEHPVPVVVLDPVMVASSGDRLISQDAEQALRELVAQADVITPNIAELAVLCESNPAQTLKEAHHQAAQLAGSTGTIVIVKGGHLTGEDAGNSAVFPDGTHTHVATARVQTKNTHGTGCSLSSSLATRLGLARMNGNKELNAQVLTNALVWSTRWLNEAIIAGEELHVGSGQGHGPVDHQARARRLEHAADTKPWEHLYVAEELTGENPKNLVKPAQRKSPEPKVAPAGPWTAALWQATGDIWRDILDLPFIRGLGDGTLDEDLFGFYLDQDAQYLAQYSRALATLSARATSSQGQVHWAAGAQAAIVEESLLHDEWLAAHPAIPVEQGGIRRGAPSAVTMGYTNFLRATAAGEDYVVGAAAALPCYWLYLEIGYRLLEKTHEEHPYNAWISVYGGEEFAADVRRCVAVVEEAFEQASPSQRVAAAQAYMSACLYERDFFDQAHRALR